MTNVFHKITAAALALAVTIPSAWADQPPASPVLPGPGNFQGPGWNGYGPAMMGGWGYGPGMMGGWGGGYGGGGGIMMIFGAVIIVALLVFIFRALAWTAHAPHQPMPHSRTASAGLHALDERYARGEINREEYLQKKRDILEG